MTNDDVPAALRQVWEWKNKVQTELEKHPHDRQAYLDAIAKPLIKALNLPTLAKPSSKTFIDRKVA